MMLLFLIQYGGGEFSKQIVSVVNKNLLQLHLNITIHLRMD